MPNVRRPLLLRPWRIGRQRYPDKIIVNAEPPYEGTAAPTGPMCSAYSLLVEHAFRGRRVYLWGGRRFPGQ